MATSHTDIAYEQRNAVGILTLTSRAISLLASSYPCTVPDTMSDQIDRLKAVLADGNQIERLIGRGGCLF